MCYLIRQQQNAVEPDSAAAPTTPGRLRPRWGIAVGAMLIGGLAVAAALIGPPATTPTVSAKPVAAAATFAATPPQSAAATLPVAGGADRVSVPGDDEVPTAFDSRKAGMGPCNHDL